MKTVLLNLTKKFFSFISVLGIISGLSSCRDNSFDWDKAHSNMTEVENAYEEHFKEIFGEVSPTQSWDFTQTSGTRAGSYNPTENGGYNSESWYEVLDATHTWLDDNLKETVNHQSMGRPFIFEVPTDGTFDLIPIYQGFASSYWDMHMVVQPVSGDPVDVKFWEKNQGIQVELEPLRFTPNGVNAYLGNQVIYFKSKEGENNYMNCNGISNAYKSKYLITSYNGKKVLYSFGGTLGDVKYINYTDNTVWNYCIDFAKLNDSPYTLDRSSFNGSVGMRIETNNWCQLYVADDISLTQNGWYILEAEIYSNNDFSFKAQVIAPWWEKIEEGTLSGKGGSWIKVRMRFMAEKTGSHSIVFQPTSSINVKNLRVYQDGGEGFMVANDYGIYTVLDPNDASAFISYDDYFTLDDRFLYNDGGTLKAYKNNSNKSWDMPDNTRIPAYKWALERENASEADLAVINNIRSQYGVTTSSKDWVNVQVTATEESTSLTTRAKRYTFSGLPAGATVYFYWETKMPFWRLGTAEAILSSLKDQMRAFDCPTPTNIPSNKIVKVIGCEAALAVAPAENPSASLGDRDYNDMVFLLVTNEEPKFVPITEEHEIITEKRYMVEDLGATDDIDFNDMVVDLRQVEKQKWTIENGVVTKKETVSTKQEVILRAMGGTLDFDFKVGNNVIFTKSKLSGINYKTMYKTGMNGGKSTLLNDYDCELYRATLNGNPWEPSTNNVSFTVYKEGTSTAAGGSGTAGNSEQVNIDNNGIYNISFPVVGDPAPRIIAFPVTKLWRDERHECCNDWLYDREPALWEMPENAPDANKNTHTESFGDWIASHRSDYLNWVETKFSTKVKNSMDSWLNKKNVVVEQ